MKIIHIITTIEVGGAENQLLQLVRRQSDMGHQVIVFPLKGVPSLAQAIEESGVEVDYTLFNRKFFQQVILILVRKLFQDSIVHCHLPRSEMLARLSREKNYIVTRHYGGAFYPEKPEILSSLLSRFATKKSKRVIAISKTTYENLVKRNEVDNIDKITVIYYGFDAPAFLEQSSRQSNRHTFTMSATDTETELGRPFKFICIARLSPEKNLPTLMKAYAKFVQSYPNSTLEIYGTGPDREKLLKLGTQLGLNSNNIFLGKVEPIGPQILEADVLILPSQFEGFGMVLLEAMALKTRVICSEIPIFLEIMGNSGACTYFKPEDWEDLCSKMTAEVHLNTTKYIDEQQKRLELFEISKTVKATIDIYCS